MADAAAVLLGPAGRTAVDVIIVVALTATVNSFVIVISRTAYVLARDARAPGVLARTTARGVPWVALVFAGASSLWSFWMASALIAFVSYASAGVGSALVIDLVPPV